MDKDTLVLVGLVVTASISLLNFAYSFRHNRRASYVNSVTATRLKWISEVRDHLSRFVALLYQSAAAPTSDPVERRRILSEIAHHGMLMRLQLAPQVSGWDRQFEEQIQLLFRNINSWTSQQIRGHLETLVEVGQRFLWEEWMKVKREAIYGDPYDRLPRKVRRWFKSKEDDTGDYIARSEGEWVKAVASGETLKIEHILADDFLGMHWNGSLCGKAEMIAWRRPASSRTSSIM